MRASHVGQVLASVAAALVAWYLFPPALDFGRTRPTKDAMDWLLQTIAPQRDTSADIYSTVFERLGPDDHLKLASLVTVSSDAQDVAILAVVSNVDRDVEEAIVLLCTTKQPCRILAVVPILAAMDAQIAQVALPDQGGDVPKCSSALKVHLSIEGQQGLEVASTAVQDVRDIVSEIRRLQAIAKDYGLVNAPDLGPWTERYAVARKGNLSEATGAAEEALHKVLHTPNASPRIARSQKSSPEASANDFPEWRRRWLDQRLKGSEADFVESERIKVRVGTWNVFSKMPSGSLKDWLRPADSALADLYVVGLQEIDDDPGAYIRHNPFRQGLWTEIVQKSLEAGGQPVVKVAVQQLVGLLILVFAKASASTLIHDVATTYVGTGTMGIGNKGAAAVRLRYRDTVLTFVNSHLAAFHDQVAARNRDFSEIARRLVFPLQTAQTTPSLQAPLQMGLQAQLYPIFQTGHLFWLGDLNYRVHLPGEEARDLCSSGDHEALLAKDQLRDQMQSGNTFHDFVEAPIRFLPTYKFDVGTSDFDTSEKRRIPAYTDRILWLPGRAGDVDCLEYSSHPSFVASDHKPVSASFEVTVYSFLAGKRDRIEADLLRELDALENEAVPDLDVEPVQLDFTTGDAVLGKTVRLRNSRKHEARWRFVVKPDSDRVCEDWLKVSSDHGRLGPGETQEVHFVVDTTSVSTAQPFGDVVILSVEGGRDVFLPVNVDVAESPT